MATIHVGDLLAVIVVAGIGAMVAAVVALAGRRWRRAVAWLGGFVVIAACGVWLLGSWNQALLRVNQAVPATRAMQ